MRLVKGDQVKVIAGKQKGIIGAILEIDRKKGLVKISQVNIRRHHIKPTQSNPDGGIIEKEGFINVSNVMLVVKEKKEELVTRIRYKIDKKNPKEKIRIATKTGKEV